MNLENVKRAAIAQFSKLSGFWTFVTAGTSNIYDITVTTSSRNITGSLPNIVSSEQIVSHTYTL